MAHAPALVLLTDVNVTYTNGMPLAILIIQDTDRTVAEVFVPDGMENLSFEFTRKQDSPRVFADNCRVFNEDDELEDQAAFSDAQVGVIFSTGTCVLEFDELTSGTYRAVYSSDQVFPQATDDVHLRVTGWNNPAPSR